MRLVATKKSPFGLLIIYEKEAYFVAAGRTLTKVFRSTFPSNFFRLFS